MNKETDDIWRLYHREWVIVHSLDLVHIEPDAQEPGRKLFKAARAWIAENLAGRVRDNDIKIVLNTDNHDAMWAHVEVFKDNLKGEFKYVENAQMYAKSQKYEEFVIVPRNSKADHDIRNYGVVKL